MATTRTVTVIGAPLDLGQSRRGVDMGPSAIRYAGLEERLAAIGRLSADRGNVVTNEPEALAVGDERARYLDEILDACARLATTVAEVRLAPARRRSSSAATTRSRSGRSPAWPPRPGIRAA